MTKSRKLMAFKHKLLVATALLGLAVSTPRAQANIFQTGDVVTYEPGYTGLEVLNPTTNSYTSVATSQAIAGYSTDVTSFGTAGILYSTGSGVNEINQSGVNSTFLTAATGDTITTVMADAHNNVFVAGYNSSTSNNFISEYTGAGSLVSTHTFSYTNNVGIANAAMSANEQMLYFDGNGTSLQEYNLATGNVGLMPGVAGTYISYGVQVMPYGDIVSSASMQINMYSSSGALLSSFSNDINGYSISGGGVAVDSAGTGYWATTVYYDINNGNHYPPIHVGFSGAEIASYSAPNPNFYGVAVIGSQNAIAAPEPAALPLFATMLSLLVMAKLVRSGRRAG